MYKRWNLKENDAEPFCSCLSCSFYFPAFVSDERLIAIIRFNASSCCSMSFHARTAKGAQIEQFVLSSLTTFPRYSLLLVGIKQTFHFNRRWRRGFYPSCHSRGFILHLELLSKHSEGGACSCSLGLPFSISHKRLSNALFVFHSLPFLPCHSLVQIYI